MKFLSHKEVLIETELSKEEFKQRFSKKIGKPLNWYATMWPFKKEPYVGSMEGENFVVKIQDSSISNLENDVLSGSKALGTLIGNGSGTRIKMKVKPHKFYQGDSGIHTIIAIVMALSIIILLLEPFFTGNWGTEILARLFFIILFAPPIAWWGLSVAAKVWNSNLDKLVDEYIQSIKYVTEDVRIVPPELKNEKSLN